MLFTFKNDIADFVGGYPSNGTSLNTTPALTLAQVRKLFINAIEEHDHKGTEYKEHLPLC